MTLLYFYRGHSAAVPKYVPSSVPEKKKKRKKASRRELRLDPKDLIPEARLGKEPSWHSKRMFFGDPEPVPQIKETPKSVIERPRPQIDLVALRKESSSTFNRLFKIVPDPVVEILPVIEPEAPVLPTTERLKQYYGITITDSEIKRLQDEQELKQQELEAQRIEEEGRFALEQFEREEEDRRVLEEALKREEEEEEDRRRKLITLMLLDD